MHTSSLIIDKFIIKFHIKNSLFSQVITIFTGALLISLLAQFRIHLPFTPVPITGQTLGIIIIGSSYGPARGVASSLLYLIFGFIGLPVFAGGTYGFSVILGPTGGYLIGFIFASYIMGKFSQYRFNNNLIDALPIFFIGHIVIFFFGVAWLSTQIGISKAIMSGLVPFIPGAIIKTFIASIIHPSILKLLQNTNDSGI